jgi:hypothetical protein
MYYHLKKIVESIQKIGEEETLNTLKKILTRKLKKISSLKIISKDLIYYPFYIMYFNKKSMSKNSGFHINLLYYA